MSEAAAQGAGPARGDPLQEGIEAFLARDLAAAHAAFARAHRQAPRDPAAMSWYGVTLVLVERNSSLGASLCDEAVRAAGPVPALVLNQARVHLALNQRERLVRALERGLAAHPDHPALVAARSALGARGAPVLPFLSRENPLNRLLGALRHRLRRRGEPAWEVSPVALGSLPLEREAPRS